jgi:hypothetical protein
MSRAALTSLHAAHRPAGLPRPFKITGQHVAARELEADTLGFWCLPVSGCWHLFTSYSEASRARAAFHAGRPPR